MEYLQQRFKRADDFTAIWNRLLYRRESESAVQQQYHLLSLENLTLLMLVTQDLAFASVESAFVPRAGNKRFVVSAGTMPSGTVIADRLVHRFPELASRVRPEGSPPRRALSGDVTLESLDTHLTASILGLTHYRRVEDTLTDIAQQILELHRRKEWKRVIQS
jgi:hypothetical protein